MLKMLKMLKFQEQIWRGNPGLQVSPETLTSLTSLASSREMLKFSIL